MLYRIITEKKNKEKIVKIVNQYFDGFTIIESIGYWQGQSENSLVIEIDSIGTDYNQIARINNIATQIKSENNQEAVLVQIIHCNSVLI